MYNWRIFCSGLITVSWEREWVCEWVSESVKQRKDVEFTAGWENECLLLNYSTSISFFSKVVLESQESDKKVTHNRLFRSIKVKLNFAANEIFRSWPDSEWGPQALTLTFDLDTSLRLQDQASMSGGGEMKGRTSILSSRFISLSLSMTLSFFLSFCLTSRNNDKRERGKSRQRDNGTLTRVQRLHMRWQMESGLNSCRQKQMRQPNSLLLGLNTWRFLPWGSCHQK